MIDKNIKKLWDWFVKHEKQIRDSIDYDSVSEQQLVTDQLNNLVLELGMFTWEVAPGETKPWSFLISPNGDAELLVKSKKIIQEAPDLKDWAFYFARQAKLWDQKLLLYDSVMDEQEVDASKWKFVKIKKQRAKCDLIIEALNMAHIDEETLNKAAHMLVVNEIGEETKINKIASIEVVRKIPAQYESNRADITVLRKELY